MTRQLMTICNGKLVLALEGGYDLPSVCDCSEAVTRALLGEEACSKVAESELARKPTAFAIENLKRVAVIQGMTLPIPFLHGLRPFMSLRGLVRRMMVFRVVLSDGFSHGFVVSLT